MSNLLTQQDFSPMSGYGSLAIIAIALLLLVVIAAWPMKGEVRDG